VGKLGCGRAHRRTGLLVAIARCSAGQAPAARRLHGGRRGDRRRGLQLEQRLRVAGARCGTFSPHAARVHPGKLLRGLAGVVQELGVRIHEGTPVTELRPHEALTPAGRVRARWVVRATEGYTAGLRGLRRAPAPIKTAR
jgi:glycine/D-amino acid oxidase-like deaminating enzyme